MQHRLKDVLKSTAEKMSKSEHRQPRNSGADESNVDLSPNGQDQASSNASGALKRDSHQSNQSRLHPVSESSTNDHVLEQHAPSAGSLPYRTRNTTQGSDRHLQNRDHDGDHGNNIVNRNIFRHNGFPDQGMSNRGHGSTATDSKSQQQSLLQGTLDLEDTTETHTDTQWAPAVTHETIKPHEHEIIQHHIHREIHNYSHHHRLQPIIHTEVLPARHFIPGPNGVGLVEIPASEIPDPASRDRWMKVTQNQIQLPPLPKTTHQWRTEPEIVECEPRITKEGFERRNTIIRYPPTLASLSDYSGEVQPMHFDHKTGESWLGELTTMEKLRNEMQQMKIQVDADDLSRSSTIKRKPVTGPVDEAISEAIDNKQAE